VLKNGYSEKINQPELPLCMKDIKVSYWNVFIISCYKLDHSPALTQLCSTVKSFISNIYSIFKILHNTQCQIYREVVLKKWNLYQLIWTAMQVVLTSLFPLTQACSLVNASVMWFKYGCEQDIQQITKFM
jgi:hypothetical protein